MELKEEMQMDAVGFEMKLSRKGAAPGGLNLGQDLIWQPHPCAYHSFVLMMCFYCCSVSSPIALGFGQVEGP